MALDTAELSRFATPGADDSAAVLPPAPAFAFCGRFGTRVLTRRASAACRMREPADAVLMLLSCAACSRIAYDAGGRSIVTRVALAISCHPLPR